MARYRLTSRGAQKRADRERQAGLDPNDEAAKWLEEHDPKPPPEAPKSATKSKTLHRWREAKKRA